MPILIYYYISIQLLVKSIPYVYRIIHQIYLLLYHVTPPLIHYLFLMHLSLHPLYHPTTYNSHSHFVFYLILIILLITYHKILRFLLLSKIYLLLLLYPLMPLSTLI